MSAQAKSRIVVTPDCEPDCTHMIRSVRFPAGKPGGKFALTGAVHQRIGGGRDRAICIARRRPAFSTAC